MLLLAICTFDFGLGMFEKLGLTNAARAGAQFAAVKTSNAQDADAIKNVVVLASGKPAGVLAVKSTFFCECSDGSSVSCTLNCAGDPPDVYIAISVDYNYTPLFPYPFLTTPLVLNGSSEFRLR